MQDVNEAWRVLRDPARRVAYDRTLDVAPPGRPVGPAPRPPQAPEPDDDLVDVAPPVGPGWAHVLRGLPWAVLLVALAVIFVFTAYASRGGDDDLVGACVSAVPSPSGTVPCDEPGARTVTAVVDGQRACPPGTTRAPWGRQDTALCLSP